MNTFNAYLQKLNIPNSAHIAAKLSEYAAFLSEKNKVMNLTAVPEAQYFEKHFYDSLLLSELYSFNDETLLDIGSGAGFPGIVLALVYPKLRITLLEPTLKRVNFLNDVITLLKIENVKVVAARAEDYIVSNREQFDLVTARAVASLNVLLELAVPFVKLKGALLLMKGQNAHEEIALASNAMNKLDVVLAKENQQTLPSDESVRINLKFVKTKQTNSKYPRNYSQIKKKPL